MHYLTIPVTDFSQNCRLIYCRQTRQAAIIDPGGDAPHIQQVIAQQNVQIQAILLTHGHLDHAGAAATLAARYHVPVIGPQREDEFWLQGLPMQSQMFGFAPCPPLAPDRWLEEGQTVEIGQLLLQVLHCPGHSPGHVVFYHPPSRQLISGDVIFKGGVGRSDLPGGDHQQLIRSIKEKLLPLGDDITFLPGHGVNSTLGFERKHNPFLR